MIFSLVRLQFSQTHSISRGMQSRFERVVARAKVCYRTEDIVVFCLDSNDEEGSTYPPANFADQFFKDLDIVVLGTGDDYFKNLDWVFDFQKLTPKTNFDATDITKFVDKLKAYNFTDPDYLKRLRLKYGVQNQDALAGLVAQKFNEIFKISN